jgi:predicted regulator of Ras-like GTPase activity (Roadblock/LC7/MglB family)
MKHILTELNKTNGVLGSAVLAPDGLVISSEASTSVASEELWQQALKAFGALADMAESAGCGQATSVSFEWDRARVLAHVVPGGILFAATRPEVPLGQAQTAVQRAAAAICETGG